MMTGDPVPGLMRWQCLVEDCPIRGQWRYGTERDWAHHQDSHRAKQVPPRSPTGRIYGTKDAK